jgi:hypothetical protein
MWILVSWVVMMEVVGTGSGLCPMAGLGISDVEPSGSGIKKLVFFD